jgi:hypothetical protein
VVSIKESITVNTRELGYMCVQCVSEKDERKEIDRLEKDLRSAPSNGRVAHHWALFFPTVKNA